MDGVINVYKPEGITSFDVVWKIRKLAHTKKVGHTGTLDPAAAGVLPICIGKGTKIVDYIMNGSKEYKTLLRLGVITDTYDREGKIISESDVNLTEEEVTQVIKGFIGEIAQIPPMYSALKVNGVRLYELARKGIEIERKERKITIFDIEILEIKLPYVSFIVKCSKGTYIRSLCYDIGEQLKCGGAMWALERIKTSIFEVENSIPLDALTEDNIVNNIISIEDALGDYPILILDGTLKKQLLNGVSIYDKEVTDQLKEDQVYRVFFKDNEFFGLGSLYKSGFKMKKLLFQE
ncbi:MAG: tRNA pseudouridine(55) synthase TruB [Clostridiaceae bacterium]|nr:tRNA pseudouridine(55) synthase TruB [Clostridiaceae bacterium]